jgi:hypothetical protein
MNDFLVHGTNPWVHIAILKGNMTSTVLLGYINTWDKIKLKSDKLVLRKLTFCMPASTGHTVIILNAYAILFKEMIPIKS